MKAALFRQDPVFRSFGQTMGVLIGLGSALISFLFGLSAWFEGVREPAYTLNFVLAFASIWLVASVFLLSPGVRARATRWGVSLPVPARALWLTHQVACFLGALFVVVVLGGVVGGAGWLIERYGGPVFLRPAEMRDLALYLPLGLALAVALVQAPRPGLREIPWSRGYAVLAMVGLITTGLALLGLTALPLPWLLLPLLAAIMITLRTARAVPGAFVLAPREPAPRPVEDRAAGSDETVWAPRSDHGVRYSWFLFRTVHRAVAKKMMLPILGYPVLFLLGLSLSGFFSRFTDGSIHYDMVFISIYMIIAFFGGLTYNLSRIDPLPLSRRWLFAMLMLPPFAVLVVGYFAGLVGLQIGGPRELIHLRTENCCAYIVVPAGRCEIAWDGEVPDNSSPWGETHRAWRTSLWRGSRAVLYSPYSNTEQSSREYVARQISRATEVVYTRGIPSPEISARYLETDANGTVMGREEGLTLTADYPDLRAQRGGPGFPVLLALVGVPAFLLSAAYLRGFRARIGNRTRQAIFYGILALTLGLHMAQYGLYMSRFTQDWIVAGVIDLGIRKLGEAFPGSAGVVWIGCALLLVGAYRVAERAFEGIEAAPGTRGLIIA